jgi:hypothetical protein
VSGDVVADLLADLLDPGGSALPAPTPAKAANPANREQACGPVPDSVPCEDLRIGANLGPGQTVAAQVSQEFATVRKLPCGLESEQRRGVSQDSHDSQAAPEGKQSQSCGGCRHLLRRGTCGEPVAAGLADAFAIRWPAEGHGSTCAAFSGKAPGKASDRPYRLTTADADGCHAPERQDADDLAERLTLRDRDDDKRVMCAECRHYRHGRCGNHRGAGLHSAVVGAELAELRQRCPGFHPRTLRMVRLAPLTPHVPTYGPVT